MIKQFVIGRRTVTDAGVIAARTDERT